MPSRFFDYESDLLHPSRKHEKKSKSGFRRPSDGQKPRRASTSEPTSSTSTRSSFSSNATSGMLSATWRAGHSPSKSTGVLVHGSHNMKDPHLVDQVEPTAQIQEWAHQMHIQQNRQYWWCSSCHPKAPTLQIPTQKTIRRVRIVEPTHAYE